MTAQETPWRTRIVGHDVVKPAELVPNPENWRSHPQAQRDALGGALDEVGWVSEVIVNRNTGRLVDGHLRLDLALSRDEAFVPVTYVELTEDEERLVLATLDPLAAMADADVIPLSELLGHLSPESLALRGMLDDLATQYGTGRRPEFTDPDDAPDVPELPDVYVKPGQVFALGDHRLMCGDATDGLSVSVLFAGARADIVWTDPPYGVDIASRVGTTSVSSSEARRLGTKQIENDNLGMDATRALVADSLRLAPLKEGGAFYVASPGGAPSLAFMQALEEVGFQLRQQLIWVKDSLVLTRQDYHWRHEPVLYGWRDGAAHNWLGGRNQDTVWEIPRPKRSESHPTMKPVELVGRSLLNSSRAGENVYDPFVGSGTTIIAAEQHSRRCYAMEIDPRYSQVAIQRWEAFTGRSAVLLDA